MNSMTGYGYNEVQESSFLLSVEIKSYNNRFLDIVHNFPFYLAPFELEIDARVKKIAQRGHVEVSVRIKQTSSDIDVLVDEPTVLRYKGAFDEIARVAGLSDSHASISDYLSAEGVLTSVRQNDAQIYEQALFSALDAALVQFGQSKAREGAATAHDLSVLASKLEQGLEGVKSHALELESTLKENLLSRFEEMLGNQNYDEARILQEVAVLLVKYSVNEEIVRLGTHLKEFDKLLKGNEPVGKRMDFLCQEMNREINTIGSKSQLVEVNLLVVDMKDSLENIREQIRNIE